MERVPVKGFGAADCIQRGQHCGWRWVLQNLRWGWRRENLPAGEGGPRSQCLWPLSRQGSLSDSKALIGSFQKPKPSLLLSVQIMDPGCLCGWSD